MVVISLRCSIALSTSRAVQHSLGIHNSKDQFTMLWEKLTGLGTADACFAIFGKLNVKIVDFVPASKLLMPDLFMT